LKSKAKSAQAREIEEATIKLDAALQRYITANTK
jgi:hypothetical protein